MEYPPNGFIPGSWTIYNGRPVYADDAQAADRYAAYLAAVHKPNVPTVILGEGLRDGVVHTLKVLVPCYTHRLAVGLLISGHGDLDVDTDEDAGGATAEKLASGDGTAYSVETATWFWFDAQVDSPSGGEHRAVTVTSQSSPHVVQVTVDITDVDGTYKLRVFGIKVVPLVLDESAVLPA